MLRIAYAIGTPLSVTDTIFHFVIEVQVDLRNVAYKNKHLPNDYVTQPENVVMCSIRIYLQKAGIRIQRWLVSDGL